jgi:hypothetical protein
MAFVLLFLFTTTTAIAATQATQYQCTLSPDLLRAYHDGGATANDFAAVRRALWPFIEHCPNGPADRASRKVLFDLIDAEFGMGVDIRREFDPADDRDHAAARDEGIRYTRRDLRTYLDAIVTPADLEFKHTILSYGRPLAIAKLGPAVRDDVVRNATTPTGVVYAYMTTTAQQEALGALGYWIDPANGNFSGAEKNKFTAILLAYLDHVPANGASVSDKSLLLEVINALGRSDSPAVEAALRNFTSKRADADLLHAAQKAANAVHGRR